MRSCLVTFGLLFACSSTFAAQIGPVNVFSTPIQQKTKQANRLGASGYPLSVERTAIFSSMASGDNLYIAVNDINFYSDTGCSVSLATYTPSISYWNTGRDLTSQASLADLNLYTSKIDQIAETTPGIEDSANYDLVKCITINFTFKNGDNAGTVGDEDVSNTAEIPYKIIEESPENPLVQEGHLTLYGSVENRTIILNPELAELFVNDSNEAGSSTRMYTGQSPKTITITNTGSGTVSSLAFDFDAHSAGYYDTSACSGSLAPGDSCNITASDTIPASATGSGFVYVSAADPSQLVSPIYFPITYQPQANSKPLCWGDNANGQVGDGNMTNLELPSAVDFTSAAIDGENISQISNSLTSTCALVSTFAPTDPGTIWCWGSNANGELGVGQDPGAVPEWLQPTNQISVGGLTFVQVTSGDGFNCGLTNAGTVYCWGRNNRGQLGDSTTTESTLPVQVSADTSNNPNAPVAESLENIIQITSAAGHSCALDVAGAVYCWGDNSVQQLGNTSYQGEGFAQLAVRVNNLEENNQRVTSIAAGAGVSCASLDTGLAKCWGSNANGALGMGNDASGGDFVDPQTVVGTGQDVGGSPLTDIVALSASNGIIDTSSGSPALSAATVCALINNTTDDNLQEKCWGYNVDRQVGVSPAADSYLTPQPVQLTANPDPVTYLANVSGISVGRQHNCAFRNGDNQNDLFCWGYNTADQVGNPSLVGLGVKAEIPVSVLASQNPDVDLANVLGLSAGGDTSCALQAIS